jgi:hypothetical protein
MLPTEKKGRQGEDLKMKWRQDARVDMVAAEIRGELGGGSRTWSLDGGCILDHGKR